MKNIITYRLKENTMKTRLNLKPVLMFLFIILLGTGSLSALEPSASCAEKMHQKLKEKISYPSSASRFSVEGYVQVIFSVNAEGRVVIGNIYGSDPDLVSYVKSTLSTLKCSEMADAARDKYFKVKFNFQLI
jgi:hypothetical protein